MFRFLVLIGSVIAAAHAFGHGAPDTVCGSLKPNHPAEPQTVPSPYEITINKEIIRPGDEVKVTLKGINGDTFKGFIIKAQSGEKDVGEFKVDPNDAEVQTINCPDGKNNAVTHRNPKEKSSITVTWWAPKDLRGIVVFKTTVVQNGLVFWVAQTSSQFTVRH